MNDHPDYQLAKFCKQYGSKKIEIISSTEPNIYLTPNLDVYKHINPDCDLILFDTTFFPNSAEQCYTWIKSLKLKHEYAFVTSNFSYFNSADPNVIYFPFYYFQLYDNPTRKIYDLKAFREYPMQCFNLNPWLHKTINILQMSKRTWFNRILATFHWLSPTNVNTPPTNLVKLVLTELNTEEINILNSLNLPITVNLPDDPHPAGWVYVSNAGRGHEVSYIDYVNESCVTEPFISEKIWKPIFSGQLFLCLGPPRIIQHLRDLGFDTFDDIIAHYKYDNIQGSSPDDIRAKVTTILDIAENLLSKDLNQIWEQTYERRLKNLNYILSDEFKFKILNKLIKKVS